jgi:DNA gyrase subunit A
MNNEVTEIDHAVAKVDGNNSSVIHGRIAQTDLNEEMKRSYLDYAMSVIVGRALPDVRDGLKPVHRRVLYGMYEGGYRPERGYSKCSRVVGEVMGKFHPHGDSAIYDTLVRMVQDWTMRYPLVAGQGNFGSPGNDPAAAPRYTECKMASIAMELVRDIEKGTVDFQDNYDGKEREPVVVPARFPNLLANGSTGIAVGMATNIPPHNLKELADGVQWYLDNPDATNFELLEALLGIIKGPDFPTAAMIVGRRGIEDAYRTGRGSILMRAVVNAEEIDGRMCLVATELPYQVNPDDLATRIAELVNEGKIQGISDVRDESSGRTGLRLVIVLKRDAVAKVVLNNLYKFTRLQDSFGANMLALVDGVPRTLSLDAFIRHWVTHQIEVIQRRTQYLLNDAERRIHILRGYLRALDLLDELIATIRGWDGDGDGLRQAVMALLTVDEEQANAILSLQLRRLSGLERAKIVADAAAIELEIADLKDILASPDRQRSIISTELAAIVSKYGDDRRTSIIPFEGDVSNEDLIPVEEMVVTITRGGFAKRTRIDAYRAQKRGGKGIKGAKLRENDLVEHFFTTTTHHWLLFFTNLGRVYRAKAYELPEGGRDAKGQHVANMLQFLPDERIASVLDIENYNQAQYLVLATKRGLVKKSALSDYDSPRAAGLIAINLRSDEQGATDELIGTMLVNSDDDLILVSRQGQSMRISADDSSLRPMGRATSGVVGMKFRDDDELLAADVIRPGSYLFTVTQGGIAKRTELNLDNWRLIGRGSLGVKVAVLPESNGDLVGALVVDEDDEVMVIMEEGKVLRSAVSEVRPTGRTTQGVMFAKPGESDSIIAVARNVERKDSEDSANLSANDEAAAIEAATELEGNDD